jgi:hypothetical protein
VDQDASVCLGSGSWRWRGWWSLWLCGGSVLRVLVLVVVVIVGKIV